jgi:hypothetical protein
MRPPPFRCFTGQMAVGFEQAIDLRPGRTARAVQPAFEGEQHSGRLRDGVCSAAMVGHALIGQREFLPPVSGHQALQFGLAG